MTIWTPGYMQGGVYTAKYDRINTKAACFDEGVSDRLALKVSQRAAGANMSVDVAAGGCVVTGDDELLQGNYDVFNDAVFNVTGFTAPGTNSRYDVVGLQLNDVNAGGAAGNNGVIVRIAGTAAAIPTIPDLSISPGGIKSFLLLAVIGPFVPSTTSITNAMIHDAYTGTGPTGVNGARLVAGLKDRPGTSKTTYATVADSGWAMEYGQIGLRADFPALFEEIGTTHNTGGEAGTEFRFPDSRGRVQVARDNMGGIDAGVLTTANVLGTKMGLETHTLTKAQLPNVKLLIDPPVTAVTGATAGANARHHHGYSISQTVGNVNAGSGFILPQWDLNPIPANSGDDTPDHGHAAGTLAVDIIPFDSPALGSGDAHNNMQPSITVNRMIRC